MGLDINPIHVAEARALASERGLANVEIVEADARRTGLPGGRFDLVYERLLLVNVPEPEQVVAEMVRLARPGAWVACEEVDGAARICHPRHPAWERMTEVLQT